MKQKPLLKDAWFIACVFSYRINSIDVVIPVMSLKWRENIKLFLLMVLMYCWCYMYLNALATDLMLIGLFWGFPLGKNKFAFCYRVGPAEWMCLSCRRWNGVGVCRATDKGTSIGCVEEVHGVGRRNWETISHELKADHPPFDWLRNCVIPNHF